jgi:hypothetical protein
MIENSNYYYIDESGAIDNNSKFFILGCYKTDSPEEIRDALEDLKNEILNAPYFAYERKKFIKEGFHGCDNHPDIKSRFFNLVATLNVRFYILILKKDSSFFEKMKEDKLTSVEIYNICINKLLSDRLTKTRNDNNVIVFEQYGSKPNNWLKNVQNVLKGTISKIDNKFGKNISYEVQVHDKSDLNLSVIDYINHIFVQFFEKGSIQNRMRQNFEIIEPKIALIYKMDKDLFYDKNNKIDITQY